MEALTNDIVFSLSAYLRPRDLFHLALTSRRFGGSSGDAFGADAEERVAKRRRPNGAEKSDVCAGDECREGSLMDEVARRQVVDHGNFSCELLQRLGGESWMAALHRLERQKQLIEEAMAAAPALFAKPGDMFRLWDRDSHLYGVQKVRYVGRNVDGWFPARGWLVFHNLDDDNEDILDSLGLSGSGPTRMYSHYTPSGDRIDQSLCIPIDKCGAFIKEGVEHKRSNLVPPRNIKERVRQLCITPQMLIEATEAAPVLVAKPVDLFEWKQNPVKKVALEYKGRNEVPSMKMVTTDFQPYAYSTPKIGWLVFHNRGHNNIDVQMCCTGGIRYGISAWPVSEYSHYDDSGKIIAGTLCIPPEKCGALSAYVEPDNEDY